MPKRGRAIRGSGAGLSTVPATPVASNTGPAPFVNGMETTNSVSSMEKKQEILPVSDEESLLSATLRNTGIFCSGVDGDMNGHSQKFSLAPGGPAYVDGMINIISQERKY
jgi:hypothetical protein